jgi:hypothetical protein
MVDASGNEEFAPLDWSRLRTSGGVTATVRRARRTHPTLRDMVAFVVMLVIVGALLGAHLAGAW